MFQGTSLLTLDAKGRLTIPTRHREALDKQAGSALTLTRHPDGCVLVYPRPVWEVKRQALAALPYQARVLQRVVLGSAVDLDIDAAGRVLVPNELRKLCGLGREVALVGLGGHLELWDSKRLAKLEKEALDGALGEAAESFNF